MALRMEMQVWENRRLLWLFVKRDFKVRYAGSVLGLCWSVINPLVMLAVYVMVIGFVLGGGRYWIDTGEGRGKEAFAIYLCCGIFPWSCMSEALQNAASAILGNASLIKKSVFPIHILPYQAMANAFVNFAITLTLLLFCLLVLQVWFGGDYLQPTAFFLPLLIGLQFFFLLGPCLLVAALNVFFRDTQQIVNTLLLIGFWITPIIYAADTFPGKDTLSPAVANAFDCWFTYNPFTHLVGVYQDILFWKRPPALFSIGYLLVFGAATYVAGKYLFTRSQVHMVDEA